MKKLLVLMIAFSAIAIVLTGCTKKTTTTGTKTGTGAVTSTDTPPAPPAESAIPSDTAE